MNVTKPPDDCRQAPPEQLIQGIGEFNAGDWFACHETLEDLWVGAPWGVRDLYQGILQVGVALHHWREGNYRGAVLLLQTGVKLLRHVAPVCQTVDVAGLIEESERLRKELERLGPERMAELDRELVPLVKLRADNKTKCR